MLIGPSGAGKSTLFRAIAGIWPYASRRYRGAPRKPDAAAATPLYPDRRAAQRPHPIPRPAEAFSETALREALAAVGLDALDGRLDAIDNWQMRLSGGEQQRLAIARALLAAPDWLFLDEATSALDEASEDRIYRALAQMLPRTTLVSIGHRSTLTAYHKRRIELRRNEDGAAILVEGAAI